LLNDGVGSFSMHIGCLHQRILRYKSIHEIDEGCFQQKYGLSWVAFCIRHSKLMWRRCLVLRVEPLIEHSFLDYIPVTYWFCFHHGTSARISTLPSISEDENNLMDLFCFQLRYSNCGLKLSAHVTGMKHIHLKNLLPAGQSSTYLI